MLTLSVPRQLISKNLWREIFFSKDFFKKGSVWVNPLNVFENFKPGCFPNAGLCLWNWLSLIACQVGWSCGHNIRLSFVEKAGIGGLQSRQACSGAELTLAGFHWVVHYEHQMVCLFLNEFFQSIHLSNMGGIIRDFSQSFTKTFSLFYPLTCTDEWLMLHK